MAARMVSVRLDPELVAWADAQAGTRTQVFALALERLRASGDLPLAEGSHGRPKGKRGDARRSPVKPAGEGFESPVPSAKAGPAALWNRATSLGPSAPVKRGGS